MKKTTPIELLYGALMAAPQSLAVGLLTRSLLEVRRKSRRRGPDARIAITEQMAKELKGGSDATERPVYLIVGIPRELAVALEAAKNKEPSLIVTPDQDAAERGRVVMP